MQSFRTYINSASAIFKNDTKMKLEYISDGLNKNYPVNKRKYSVFQENETVTEEYESEWFVWNDFSIASFGPGVDLLNPKLSYMVSIEWNWNRTFISQVGQKGAGLRSYQLETITELILTWEAEEHIFQCASIGFRLRNQLIQDWNVFSSNIPLRHAVSAYVFDEQFIYFKPAKCYHLLYLKYPDAD